MQVNLGIINLFLFPPTNTCYCRNRLTKAIQGSPSGPDSISILPEHPVFLVFWLKKTVLTEGQGGEKGNRGRTRSTVAVQKYFLLFFFFMCVCFNYAGNDSKVDGLVNFEKLRMIAKEIRQVVRMTSANMDPAVMFRQRCAVGRAIALKGSQCGGIWVSVCISASIFHCVPHHWRLPSNHNLYQIMAKQLMLLRLALND